MKQVLSRILGVLLISVIACAAAFGQAQGTAQINGVVKDPSGAVLPGVEVTATQTGTNVTHTAITNETGSFVLSNLQVGPYKVEAMLPGFRAFVQTGIELGVNQNPNLNVTLQVGQVSQEVDVQANVTMVETNNLGVRQVIENQEILDLPLQSRNPTDLLGLSGGAVPDAAGNASTRALQGGVGISINGLAEGSTTFTLDGALHTNPFDNLNLPVPFPDALQEFSINTGSQNSSGGFQGGSTVASVTKSGTNNFRGDGFDYYRNDKFGTRVYNSATKGTRTREQVGGTVGGPILKNKLFFFGAYQYTKNDQAPTDTAFVVPTPQMLAGDFSGVIGQYTDPTNLKGGCQTTKLFQTGGSTPGAAAGTPGSVGFMRLTDSPNFINPARFDPVAVKLVHLFPQVNGVKDDAIGAQRLPLSMWADNPMQPGHSGSVGTDPCGRVWVTSYNQSHDSQIIGKIDYTKSARNSIFGRFYLTPQIQAVPNELETSKIGFQDTATLGGNGFQNSGDFFTIGDTYVFSPTLLNTFGIAVNRTFIHRVGPFAFDVNDVGINAFTYLKKVFYMAGLTGAGGNAAVTAQSGVGDEATNSTNSANLTDSVNLVHGKHQMSFGGSLARWKIISYANVRDVPTFNFGVTTGDLTSTGVATADFLLGKFQSIRQSSPNGLLMAQWYTGFHAQDQWKVTNRLTLNAGVRWEPFFPQQQLDGHIYNFDYQKMLANQKSQVFVNAPPGFTYPGDPGFPNGQAGMNKNWKTLGPRVGFGWDPKGDGKMSIRGSYAISYDFVNGQFHFNTNIAPPFGNDTTITPGGTAKLENPWADFPGGTGFAPGQSIFPYDNSTKNKNIGFAPAGVFLSLPADQPATYVESWNLSVQRTLPGNLFLSVQYVGNGTRHGWGTFPMNPAIYVPGTGATTGGCMVPDGRGGTQSLLVVTGIVKTLAAAQTATNPCSTTANTQNRRILSLSNAAVGTYAGSLDSYEAGNNSEYNGLVVSVRRQASKNLTINANYTWSHCINDINQGLTGMPNVDTGNTYTSINGQDPGTPSTAFFDQTGKFLPGVTSLTAAPAHREWNRSNCATGGLGIDHRQRFTGTAVTSTPKFSNTVLRAGITGWSVSSIFQWYTGSYLTVAGGGDTALIGGNTSGQTALQQVANPYADGRPDGPRAQYLATGAFVTTAPGILSPNHGRSNIVGPSFWQWDAAISRNFQVGEGRHIQARIDAYNVTNSFRPSNPSTSLTSSYGQITGSQVACANCGNRDMQFALKFFF